MSQTDNEIDREEWKAELRALHARIAELSVRVAALEPAGRGRASSKFWHRRWPLALGLIALGLIALAAVAGTEAGDPITIGTDGKVTIGTSLGVDGVVKAPSFEGDGSGLAVNGHGSLKAALDGFRGSIQALEAKQRATEQSVAPANGRISGIKLTESQRSFLTEFAWGGESIASQPLTFAVGSRDGTGCGITNRVYVKPLGLSIPAQ